MRQKRPLVERVPWRLISGARLCSHPVGHRGCYRTTTPCRAYCISDMYCNWSAASKPSIDHHGRCRSTTGFDSTKRKACAGHRKHRTISLLFASVLVATRECMLSDWVDFRALRIPAWGPFSAVTSENLGKWRSWLAIMLGDVFIHLLHRRHSSDPLSLGGWSCSCDLGSFHHLHYANAKRDCRTEDCRHKVVAGLEAQ